MNRLLENGFKRDAFEAIPLSALEGSYQEEAAKAMHVSRQTLARVLRTGRRKVTDARVHGKTLRIEGLKPAAGTRCCPRCRRVWIHPPREGLDSCPECGNLEPTPKSD